MSAVMTMTDVRLHIRRLTDRLRAGEAVVVESYGDPVAVMLAPAVVRGVRELHGANGYGRCTECFQPVPCATVRLFEGVALDTP